MKSPLLILITFFSVVMFSGCASVESSNIGFYRFKMTNYGIYTREVASETRSPDTPSGTLKTLSKYTFINKTDRIPLKIGTSFGFEYRIETEHDVKSNEIEVLLIRYLPSKIEIASRGRGSDYINTSIHRAHNRTYLTGFTIEDESQMLPGTWRFIMMYHGQVALKKEFVLYAEEDETAENEAAGTQQP